MRDSFSRVAQDTGASVALLYLILPGGQVHQLAMIIGVSRQMAAPWTRVALDASTPVTDAIRERHLVWLNSPQEIARTYPTVGLVVPYDFMLAAAPITCGANAWGGIALFWPLRHPPQLSPRERDTINTYCHQAGFLLQQAAGRGTPLLPGREPQVLTPTRRRLPGPAEALAAVEFTERLPFGCCALDLDGRVTFVNAAAADLLGTGVDGLLGTEPWDSLPWLRHPAFNDKFRAAVIGHQPTSFTTLRPQGEWLSFQLYPDSCGVSVHIYPSSATSGTTVTQDRQSAPEQSAPEQTAAYYQLMHLAAALSQAVGVQDVVDLVGDQLVPSFGPQGLALMLIDEGRLRIVGYRGYSADFMTRFDGALVSALTPPAQALASGTPGFFTSFADFQRAYPEAVRYGSRDAWAFLPLITTGRPVGTLVLSYDRPRPFPPAERAALTAIAGLVAQALDRARLFDTKQRIAHSLQTCLLPRTLPRIPGLEAAARYQQAGRGMEVGGDFYDLIHCNTAGAAAVIGDVQGHGVNAAALMGQIRAAIHSHATAGPHPGEVLTCTNRLLADLDMGLFASCLYARLDLDHHRAQLANAGHLPPLIRYPDGRTDIVRLPPGLLMGVEPHTDYATTDVPLPPGSVLALYTDGLVEAPGTDIDDAITDLARHLARADDQSAEDLADTLMHHAASTTPGTDDMALLLVRSTG
ncbi:SpoIIE family protein phosphatase [Streptomyces sp. NPDC001070]